MSVYPGATFKPTSFGRKVARTKGQRGILHVAVVPQRIQSLAPSSSKTWHMFIGGDGTCEQYVDSDHRSGASGDANDDAFSIETAGGTGSSAVLNAEKWTPAQVARIADVMRWLHTSEGVPLEVLPDARSGRRGWGPHRLGIKHSGGPRPGWWQPGSESWSSVLGKECPGDAKVAQIPGIVELARTGADLEEDDMSAHAEQLDRIEAILMRRQNGGVQDVHNVATAGLAELRKLNDALTGKVAAVGDIDEKALAAALAPSVIQALGTAKGISGADVEAAVRRVLADAATG